MAQFKILIIQHKMIGDVIASTVICEFVKKKYKEAEVHFLAKSGTLAVLDNNPHIDNVIEYKSIYSENFKFFNAFIKSIQSQNYDIVIDVYCKILSGIISWKSKAPTRISYHKWYSHFFYTQTVKRRKTSETIASLAIENRLLLVNEPSKVNSQLLTPKIYITDSEKIDAKNVLKRHDLFGKPLVMLSILGSSESKSYPDEYMSQLINYIASNSNAQFLLNYMPKQTESVEQICSTLPLPIKHRVHFEPYGKGLRQFLALLFWCDALIGNEGGATNMAKALNIPTFSIFSPKVDKEGWNIFEDEKKHMSVHLNEYRPELFKNKSSKQIKKQVKELYTQFPPSLFSQKLKKFCMSNIV